MLLEPKVNILIVDDRPENLIALESVLEDLGQNLVRATSGMEALKCVLNQDFAVILMDVQMPGMDGFETATLMRAREKTRHIPIIFLTAINKTANHVFQGYSVGAVDYLFKPYEPDVLRAKVAAFVEMSRNFTRLREEIAQREMAEARLDSSNAMLETISRALMIYIADGHPTHAFEHIVQSLLTLTESEFSFLGEILYTAKGQPYLKYFTTGVNGQRSSSEDQNSKPVPPLLQATDMKQLCLTIEATGKPLIANIPSEYPELTIFREHGSQLSSLVALPIYKKGNLLGVLGLANSPGAYDEELAVSLEPLCNTCAGIIDGYRNAQKRQQAEEQVRKLNEDLECRVEERTADLESANRERQAEVMQHQRAKEILAKHQEHIEALNARLQRSMTETHHRVKNNLQIVAAMLDMRLMDGTPTIPTKDIQQLGHHVRSLAAVHDLLTHESKEGDGQAHYISAQALLNELIPMLKATTSDRMIQYDIADIRLSARQGTSLALIVNELVSNAIKYGKDIIGISFSLVEGGAVLEVSDNGPGFAADFDPVKAANTGLDLVQHLSHWDLGATVAFENGDEGGARIQVTIPIAIEQIEEDTLHAPPLHA